MVSEGDLKISKVVEWERNLDRKCHVTKVGLSCIEQYTFINFNIAKFNISLFRTHFKVIFV